MDPFSLSHLLRLQPLLTSVQLPVDVLIEVVRLLILTSLFRLVDDLEERTAGVGV